jgi:hypothetical protein
MGVTVDGASRGKLRIAVNHAPAPQVDSSRIERPGRGVQAAIVVARHNADQVQIGILEPGAKRTRRCFREPTFLEQVAGNHQPPGIVFGRDLSQAGQDIGQGRNRNSLAAPLPRLGVAKVQVSSHQRGRRHVNRNSLRRQEPVVVNQQDRSRP